MQIKFGLIKKYFILYKNKNTYIPSYRVVRIFEDCSGHKVKIQLINKNITFDIKPEEILANDKLVNRFSPCDIRTLTYLGYLGINGPKYSILAKKLSENEKQIIFSIKEKGKGKIVTKTAAELAREATIIHNLNAQEALEVGYTLASENLIDEQRQKQQALAQDN